MTVPTGAMVRGLRPSGSARFSGSVTSGGVGGFTPNPTHEEVCSGRTGHTEAVLVAFDPAKTSYAEILTLFCVSCPAGLSSTAAA